MGTFSTAHPQTGHCPRSVRRAQSGQIQPKATSCAEGEAAEQAIIRATAAAIRALRSVGSRLVLATLAGQNRSQDRDLLCEVAQSRQASAEERPGRSPER